MIVLGADTHERSHTVVAVAAATGELVGEQTVQVGERGFDALLRWARGLDGERVWALGDCRHVCGGLGDELGDLARGAGLAGLASGRRGLAGRRSRSARAAVPRTFTSPGSSVETRLMRLRIWSTGRIPPAKPAQGLRQSPWADWLGPAPGDGRGLGSCATGAGRSRPRRGTGGPCRGCCARARRCRPA